MGYTARFVPHQALYAKETSSSVDEDGHYMLKSSYAEIRNLKNDKCLNKYLNRDKMPRI